MTAAADDSMRRLIVFSAAGHVAILFFFTVTTYLIGPVELDLPQAIRVDVVGLPQKNPDYSSPPEAKSSPRETPESAHKTKPKLPPKEATKPVKPDVPTLPNAKAKKVEEEKRKKAMERALEDLKRQSAQEKAMAEAMEKLNKKEAGGKKGSAPIAGTEVNAGDSPTGRARIDFDRYFAELKRSFNSNFEIPQWLAELNLSAAVHVNIDERGYVTRKQLVKSSGNQSFDDAVMGTIEKTSPVSPPPESIRGILATRGITVKFPE